MKFYAIDESGTLLYDMFIAEEADPDFLERLRSDDSALEISTDMENVVCPGWKYYKETDEYEPPEPEIKLTSSMIINMVLKGVNQV